MRHDDKADLAVGRVTGVCHDEIIKTMKFNVSSDVQMDVSVCYGHSCANDSE